MSLTDDYDGVGHRIDEYIKDCQHWWVYNGHWKNGFFAANIICSVGATIAGLFKQALVAGIFGALLTGILAVQKQKGFDGETSWYGNALARCKVLKNKVHSSFKSPEKLQAIEEELNQIIAEEGEKSKGVARK